MKKPLLTISLLSCGRPESLWKCLDSLKLITAHVASEVLITDTGCSREVREKMASYADRILDFTWCNDFSAARNLGLREAKGEWFLFLDDDEWFVDAAPIVDFFQSEEYREYDSASYLVRNYLDKQGRRFEDGWVFRMKRIEQDVRFVSRIHEYLVPSRLPMKLLPAMVEHYGYAFDTQEERKQHSMRNIPPLLEMMKEESDNLQWPFQLVQEYMATEEYQKAIDICNRNIDLISGKTDHCESETQFLGFFYAAGATAYTRMEKDGISDGARSLAEKGLCNHDLSDLARARLYYILADQAVKAGNFKQCRENCDAYLGLYEKLKDDPEEQYRQGGMYIRDTFTTSIHDPICCMIIKCGAAGNTDDELLKYFGEISWEEAAVYTADKTIEDIFDIMSKRNYREEYTHILNVLCGNEQMCTSAMKEYEAWRKRQDVSPEQVHRIAELFQKADLPTYENLYLQITMADASEDTEKLAACYLELFSKFADLFHFSDEYFEIAERNELPLEELFETIPFEQWKDGIRVFCVDSSEGMIRKRLEYAGRHMHAESLRLRYFQMIADMTGIGRIDVNSQERKADHGSLRERFRALIDKIFALFGPYYTDLAFEGDMKLLPDECRGAIYLGMLLEYEEKCDLGGVKNLIEKCTNALPEIREVLLSYVREMAELFKKNETDRSDEMAYLAAKLKRKAKELEEAGNAEAASQIRDQLKALGMM